MKHCCPECSSNLDNCIDDALVDEIIDCWSYDFNCPACNAELHAMTVFAGAVLAVYIEQAEGV